MTLDELTDRLREAIVLHGPDGWQTNGYLRDAQRAGLSADEATRLVSEVTQEINGNSFAIQNIRARIDRLVQPARSHLFDQDLPPIINAAQAVKLSPTFVRNQWVPLVRQRLADSMPSPPVAVPIAPIAPASPPNEPTSTIAPPEQVAQPLPQRLPPVPIEANVNPPAEPEPYLPPVVEPVTPISAPPSVDWSGLGRQTRQQEEPPPLVHYFTATPARIRKGDNVVLEWDVDNLLAVTIDDLGEGLSPKNRGWLKPSATTDYTLFDANNNPLSTVRVEVIPRDRSGIYGVIFALVLLAILYWFIKSSNADENEPARKPKIEQTSSLSAEPPRLAVTDPVPAVKDTIASDTTPSAESTDEVSTTTPEKESTASSQPAEKPALELEGATSPPADSRLGKYEDITDDKPYDRVELGADEQGWRRARSGGRWGYVNQEDEWVIKPEFEAVTPFRGSTATVFLNGQLIVINRSGEQVRK